MSFESWCEKQCSLHKQFAFWSLVKEFENTVLLFVRSFRESNFGLYLDAMISLIPWFFALDRTNYARWLSVHIRDMVDLPNANIREVFNHFNLGKFTVKKTSSKFSGISIDQAHEQLNAVVKGDGGVIGLTENDSALQRWILAGPEVARLLAEFRSSCSSVAVDDCHHEQQASIQKAFVREMLLILSTPWKISVIPLRISTTSLFYTAG